MCHFTPTVRFLQQAIPNGCSAKALGPSDRLTIGLYALAGAQSITSLADDFDVSRKFVYQQAATAQTALQEAFASPDVAEEQVLFHLPVTKAWLRQATLGLTLICHSSFRGVHEFCRDLFDVNMPIGTVHNILQDAVAKARPHNLRPSLRDILIAALDEIFQSRRPVLVGADVASTYCFLLSDEDHRDADTWGVHLLDLKKRGFDPKATIADFGTGLRAGQKIALPDTPCRGDVFHVLQEITPLVTYLENRAYDAIGTRHGLEQKRAKQQRQGCSARHCPQQTKTKKTRHVNAALSISQKLRHARRAEPQAVALADDIALLAHWLHYDIFAVSGLSYGDRCALFDFIVAELKAREHLCPYRIKPVCNLLQNQREEILAFAAQLELDLTSLAKEFQVPLDRVRELLNMHNLDPRYPRRWQKEAALRQQLGDRFFTMNAAVQDVADQTVRASSVIENLNSRLRAYFFLRRHLGSDYLALLQFFLNHRCFLRSEHPDRVGKSPAELLTGETHPHWLEMLGYTRFVRN
jgi:hypothetical protein